MYRAIGVVAVLACGGIAMADTVEVLRIGGGLGRNMTLYGSQVGGSFTFNVGQLTHDFRNGTGEGAFLNGIMPVFCTDLEQDSSANWEVYTIVPLANAPLPGPQMGPAKAQAIADVWNAAAGQQWVSNDVAAALQMLIWDIVYDFDGTQASVDVDTGTVRFGDPIFGYYAGVVSVFNTLRGSIGTNSPIGDLRGLTHPEFQDQIAIIPAPGAAAIGVGAVVIAAHRRRRG